MPTKEYYAKHKEYCKEMNRKCLKKHRENRPLTQLTLEKNRINASEWLKKNRDRKKIYLKAYNKNKRFKKDKCELCDIDIPEVLDSHHIIQRSMGGSDDPENRITVCANCHRMIHAGILELHFE